jgi:hypothetical protein
MVGVEREANPKKWNYCHFHTYPLMNALKERETEGLEQMRKTANEKQSMGPFYLLPMLKIVRMRARARVCISYFTICRGITYKQICSITLNFGRSICYTRVSVFSENIIADSLQCNR